MAQQQQQQHKKKTDWVKTQKEVFTNWFNTQIIGTGLPPLTDISEGFKDGRYLCKGIEKLAQKKIRHHENIVNDYQRLENIQNAINFLADQGIQLVNIGAPDILAGQDKIVLGLVWQLIQHYQVDTKAQLLKYCNETLEPYGIHVKDFTNSWKGGLALAALICAASNGKLLDIETVRADPGAILPRAITLAEEKLNIPALIKADYLLTDDAPDEKAMMTYISYFPKSKLKGPSEIDKIKDILPALEKRFREVILPELQEERKKKFEKDYETESKDDEIVQVVKRLEEYVHDAEKLFAQYHAQIKDLQERASRQDQFQLMFNKSEKEAKELQEEVKQLESQLQNTMLVNKNMGSEINLLRYKLKSLEESRVITKKAPEGKVTLMFTDVQSSTSQWEKDPEVMSKAMKVHNTLFRKLIEEYNGYEVKTEGDAFMIAFQTPLDAVNLAMRAQVELLSQDWPKELLENKDSQLEQTSDGETLWNGLRVRMGMHTGSPECSPDPITNRMDYHGPMVNRSARVGGFGNGGQVLVSGDVWEIVKPELDKIFGEPVAEEKGYFRLKGLDFDMLLVQLLPKKLNPRKFGEAKPELPEEAKGLEEKLKELQEKNAKLLVKLKDIKEKANQAKKKAVLLQEQMQNLKVALGESDAEKLSIITEQLTDLHESQNTLATGLHDANSFYEDMKMSIINVRKEMDVIAEGVRKEMSDKITQLTAEKEKSEEESKELNEKLNNGVEVLNANEKNTIEKFGELKLKHDELTDRVKLFGEFALGIEKALLALSNDTKKHLS